MRFPWQRVLGSNFGGGAIGVIKPGGGKLRDGEAFSVLGNGFTGLTTCLLNGITCTSFVVVNDNKITAVAPADDLVHATKYSIVIQ